MSTALKIAAGLSVIGLGVVAYDSLIGVATIEVVHHEDLGVAFVAFEAAPEEVFVDPVVALEMAFA